MHAKWTSKDLGQIGHLPWHFEVKLRHLPPPPHRDKTKAIKEEGHFIFTQNRAENFFLQKGQHVPT